MFPKGFRIIRISQGIPVSDFIEEPYNPFGELWQDGDKVKINRHKYRDYFGEEQQRTTKI
jgi:hypothetical protein